MPKSIPNTDAKVLGGLVGILWGLVVSAGVAIKKNGVTEHECKSFMNLGKNVGDTVAARLAELKVDEWSQT